MIALPSLAATGGEFHRRSSKSQAAEWSTLHSRTTLPAESVLASLALLAVAISVIELANLPLPALRFVAGLAYLLLLPGALALFALRLRFLDPWESVVYALGLSLAFLLATGLLINTGLALAHVPRPLALPHLIFGVDAALLPLFALAFARSRHIRWPVPVLAPRWPAVLMLGLTAALPLLALAGAAQRSTSGGNRLMLAMFAASAATALLAILFRRQLSPAIYATSLFGLAAAILLSFSMLTPHILGFDINQEFEVFQLTKLKDFWSPANLPGNAYNACLSITLLPVIFSHILGINDEYIFKFVFQLIFAFTPAIMFLTLRRFVPDVLAFAGALLLISQTWFGQQLPSLNRQELALLFFTLLLHVAFSASQAIPRRMRTSLFIVFGAAMVLSHYSTSYVALLLLCSGYLGSRLLPRLRFFRARAARAQSAPLSLRPLVRWRLSGWALLALTGITLTWNGPIGQTFGNVEWAAAQVQQSLHRLPPGPGAVTVAIQQLFFSNGPASSQASLDHYISTTARNYHQVDHWDWYPAADYAGYQPRALPSQVVPSRLPPLASQGVHLLMQGLRVLLDDALLLVGLAGLLLSARVRRTLGLEFTVMTVAGLAMLGLTVAAPPLAYAYNLTRLYLQLLAVLALPAVLTAGMLGWRGRWSSVGSLVLGAALAGLLLNSGGVINQLAGGPPTVLLNSVGDQQAEYVISRPEIVAAQWLAAQHPTQPVFADHMAGLRLHSFGLLDSSLPDVLPQVFTRDSYVYLDATNWKQGVAMHSVTSGVLRYPYPLGFLDRHKNLIYSSGGAVVFH